METHSATLIWKIPWTEEPGGLQYTGSQRIGHDGEHTYACSSVGGFPSHHNLVRFVTCVLVDDSCSDECEVVSHYGFNWHYPGA